jgi:hypothetical protein
MASVANPEQLAILQQGAAEWNRWRAEHPEEPDLLSAGLSRAGLHGATLSEADLRGAIVGRTVFADVDLSVAKGLDAINHHGPSTIGIDTIYKSRGNIPEAFFRGAGVPDNLIAYIGSLVGKPIEFYSCSISYSTKDPRFAERLFNNLQGNGVRCWFAPEHLKLAPRPVPRSMSRFDFTTNCCWCS